MRSVIIAFMVCAFMTGCAASRIDYNKQSMNLSLGMDKTSVQSLMGEPRRTDVNVERERWIYWSPAVMGFTAVDNENLAPDRLVVTFEGGKVVKWGNQTMTADILEASQKSMEAAYRLAPKTTP